jgi:hypothetical protein
MSAHPDTGQPGSQTVDLFADEREPLFAEPEDVFADEPGGGPESSAVDLFAEGGPEPDEPPEDSASAAPWRSLAQRTAERARALVVKARTRFQRAPIDSPPEPRTPLPPRERRGSGYAPHAGRSEYLPGQHRSLIDRIRDAAQLLREPAQGAGGEGVRAPRLHAAMMALRNQEPIRAVTSLDDLRSAGTEDRILLADDALAVLLGDESAELPHMVQQPPRKTTPGLRDSEEAPKLQVWIEDQILDALRQAGGDVYLFPDQVLAWARRERRSCLLFTGGLGPATRSTPIDIWHFSEGHLKEFKQLSTVARTDPSYIQELAALVDSESGGEGAPKVLFEALDRRNELAAHHSEVLRTRFLQTGLTAGTLRYGYVRVRRRDISVPAVLAGAALALLLTVTLIDAARFASAAAQFRERVVPVQDAYSQGDQTLADLQNKRRHMEQESRYAAAAGRMAQILDAVARLPQVSIRSVALRAEPPVEIPGLVQDPPPDYVLVISVPAHPSRSAVEQAQPLLSALMSQTRSSAALTRQTTRVVRTAGEPDFALRDYQIEGRFAP